MPEFSLIKVFSRGEDELLKFTAPDAKAACERHIVAWKKRESSSAVVLGFEDGSRHSYRDSQNYLASLK